MSSRRHRPPLLVGLFECVRGGAALRAHPIIRQLFKRSVRVDPLAWVAFLFLVDTTARCAHKPAYGETSLSESVFASN